MQKLFGLTKYNYSKLKYLVEIKYNFSITTNKKTTRAHIRLVM